MQSKLLWGLAASAICFTLGSGSAFAQAGKVNALGAEIAGNAAGTIPEWTGGLTKAPAGFDPKKGYVDPFASEKPLFVINQSNLAQHEKFCRQGKLRSSNVIPATVSRFTKHIARQLFRPQ